MKNIKYKYINTKTCTYCGEDVILPIFLDFDVADELMHSNNKEFIGSTDDGWNGIYKINGAYYLSSFNDMGEYYLTEVELID